MGIEWFHSGALICLMAGSTYTVICVKIYKILVKKRRRIGRHIGRRWNFARRLWGAMLAGHVGIEWFHSGALICLMAGSTYTLSM